MGASALAVMLGALRALTALLALTTLTALTALTVGCTGEPALSGLEEPFRVPAGTFREGDLPGSPPVAAGEATTSPRVTVVESVNNVLRPGQVGKSLHGRTTTDAVAVALRFADLGTGHWVVPVGGPDPQAGGELTWTLALDVAHDAPPGLHPLRVAALDEAGNAGTQAEITTCVTGVVPDNLNACDPTIAPPRAVLSLAWTNDADLDLVLVTPSGKIVSPKQPTTAPPGENGTSPDLATDGVFDLDANAGCVRASTTRENIVWQGPPEHGPYLVYVNLHAACGEPAATFTVSLHLPTAREGGGEVLAEALHVPGQVLALHANGGAEIGLYVTAFAFQ
ncbi:Hypothetical protein CAP_6648 [Chondromyces apiculatus DSM 436]|uniref:Uncharacterized protein n=1 Tax=Chondromyces apiculatus DSM 436 TaxID=1192034 RepID=A0A017T090_9BACT|nr:Hypothetical protein CAP_6648 [Chondromyces apiculatus DSM 436]